MSCCGKNRTLSGMSGGSPSDRSTANRPRYEVFVEYTGRTALVVIGPVSGRYYRFTYPGARLPVDARDRAALRQIDHLRIVE